MNNYNIIYSDLLELEPLEVTTIPIPYDPTQDIILQIQIIYRKLQRAKWLKKRTDALTYTYYLGQLLEIGTLTPAQRSLVRNQLSQYYARVAVRAYYLFENLGVEQIMRTKHTILFMIDKLIFGQYSQLIEDSQELVN